MYHIKKDYIHREDEVYYDDTPQTDKWQKEVYLYARYISETGSYKNIVDFGCGSGFKLLNYFNNYNTVGVDLPKTIDFLKQTYPNKTWVDNINDITEADVFIASDVIEHMKDPDILIDIIKKINPKEIIISTADRNLTVENWGYDVNGPPDNIYHIREWSFDEFKNYIGTHFNIIKHEITNRSQCTQMIHARIKNG